MPIVTAIPIYLCKVLPAENKYTLYLENITETGLWSERGAASDWEERMRALVVSMAGAGGTWHWSGARQNWQWAHESKQIISHKTGEDPFTRFRNAGLKQHVPKEHQSEDTFQTPPSSTMAQGWTYQVYVQTFLIDYSLYRQNQQAIEVDATRQKRNSPRI